MACNLNDPQISEAYSRIVSGDGTDWMIIGYGKTRDTLSLYATGSGGISEMALNVPEEVVFGFLVFEGSNVLVTHVSEKISGVQRARGLAHQKTVAGYFEHHDVTVNTSKPSELTPAMLRDKTRHLAIKTIPMKAAGADRSDAKSPSKLRTSIWRQRSVGSSRAAPPLEPPAVSAPDGSPKPNAATKAESADAAEPALTAESEPAPTLLQDAGENEAPQAAETRPEAAAGSPSAKGDSSSQADSAAGTQDADSSSTNDASKHAPAALDVPLAGGNRHSKTADPNSLINGPPTPNSFSDATKLPRDDAAATTNGVELEKPGSRGSMASSFSISSNLESASNVSIQSDLPPPGEDMSQAAEMPAIASGQSSHTSLASSHYSAASASASSTASAGPNSLLTDRYSAGRSSSKLAKTSTSRKPRAAAATAPSISDMPEMRNLLEKVEMHRKEAVSLAESSGILGDRYFECLRGYATIQQPTNAFWKRRYFVIANSTLFTYTNECSRVPTDYLPLAGVVAPPRDAEDEVLMPHSIALRFESGEYLMYFDSDSVRQAFESEIRKAIMSSLG
ncbi:hypothetical protein GQ54DRAFT_295186 [Martensiomyces pterosporus]|nr:hypothetical protein GQ54DRAFT_295186 [Martensiomyces pterosporus]